MDDKKQFWIDFVEGRISVPKMLRRVKMEPALLEWLTSVAPSGATTYVPKEAAAVMEGKGGASSHPFDAALQLQVDIHDGRGGDTLLSRYMMIHENVSRVLTEAFPEEDIRMDVSLQDRYCFMLENCPRYIGGHEVDHILEEELEKIPLNLTGWQKGHHYLKRLRERFHVQLKHPEWVDGPQWPAGADGEPMRFLRQRRRVGMEFAGTCCTRYYFEDVQTGEVRVIQQSISI